MTNVLDFIPSNLHASIKDGTTTADLTAYFQAAASTAQSLTGSNAGVVFVPNGRYLISRVGIGPVIFRGESTGGVEVKAYSAGGPEHFLFDAMLNTDGSTTNTSGGGWCERLTLDCRDANGAASGRSGLRTYGGGQSIDSLVVKHAGYGLAVGLPVWSTIKNVYCELCDIGIFTFHAVGGDNGTSTTFIDCWSNSCTTYGFHISQLYYSSFINCVAQESGVHNFFVEGNLNSNSACFSLQFTGCATEGSGTPFYFKKCRELTLTSPRVIAPDSDLNFVTFDDVTGSVIDFSALGAPISGKYVLNILNHSGGEGSITLVGGDITYPPAMAPYVTSAGARANGSSCQQTFRQIWNHSNAAERFHSAVDNIDGYSGLELSANDGHRVAAFRRVGTPIFSTSDAINSPSTNLNNGDVSFYVETNYSEPSASKLVFVVKDGTGVVRFKRLPFD